MADIPKTLVEPLLRNIGKAEIIDKIILPGYIHPDILPAFYTGATAFLYPSLRESFGLPILEAMACGTPVITSNVAAMPEIAGEAALLVNPYDSSSILSAMQKIISCPVTGITNKGLKQAAKFSWSDTAIQVLSLYKSLYPQSTSSAL
jgi:glycosyltransferase involved in cell wall biosynthesis